MYHDYAIFCSKLRDQLGVSIVSNDEENSQSQSNIKIFDENQNACEKENIQQLILKMMRNKSEFGVENYQKKEEKDIHLDSIQKQIDSHYNH